MNWLLWAVGLLLLIEPGCASHPPPHALAPRSQPTVILVPGYYGSRLVQVPDRALHWVSALQGLGVGRPLTLPLPELGLEGPHLEPDGILEEVRIVPGLFSIEAYGGMQDALRRAGFRVVSLDYDWRDDLLAGVRRLQTAVAQLRGEGTTALAIVAHSMGGLIAAYYLRYGGQDVDGAVENWEGARHVAVVVMAGVPFRGTMTAFRNMTYGRTVGLNSALLNFQAVASFPATYYLLPKDEGDRLFVPGGPSRTGMIGDPENWRRFRWGLMRGADQLPPEMRLRRFGYTAEWLNRAHRFHRLLHAPLGQHPAGGPKVCVYLSGGGEETLAGGLLVPGATGRLSILFEMGELPSARRQEDSVLFADGDGSVTVSSAALPEAFTQAFSVMPGLYKTDHVGLMNRDDIQRDIIAALRGLERERAL